VIATINHNIDKDTAEYIVKEFGHKAIIETEPSLEIEKKKEQTVDMKQLQFIASLQLVESALQVCPDNVPEKIEKQFKIEAERLKKLQGL